jgi:transposase InsO family protein
VKYGFIRTQAGNYPVRVLCRVLGVSASGYYAWRSRGVSARQQANAELLERIREIRTGDRESYGSPRVHSDLREEGVVCSVNRVARVMRAHGIRVVRKPQYIVTTESGGTFNAAPNLLGRRFRPGEVLAWVADLTYVRTDEGTLYLTVVLKLCSRRVIGWSMGNSPSGLLALDALKMAIDNDEPQAGLIHHADRGGQYASNVYRAMLAKHGMQESMSRKGDCWDNAVVESFFATLKRELLYPQRVRTRQQARSMIFHYIEVFYNRQRKHSALGYLSPVAYEKLHADP